MAPKTKTKTPSSLARSIALPYKVYFLYLDPIFVLGGVYLLLTDPSRFISGTVPYPLTLVPTPISPLIQLLLTNIAALYAYLAINEATILRLTNQLSVWKAVIGSLVLSDVGHVYALWGAAPERLADLGSWTRDEWINIGILVGGLGLRLAFLAGIGNGKRS